MSRPDDAAVNAAITLLRGLGYGVAAPEQAAPWEPPLALWHRLGCPGTLARFYSRLSHAQCPPCERRLGPKGTTNFVRATPSLVEWLTAPAQPGRRFAP